MREYIDRQTLLARAATVPTEERTWATAIELIENIPQTDVARQIDGIICEKDMIDKERRYWHKKAERYENTILRLAVLMAQGGDTDADN